MRARDLFFAMWTSDLFMKSSGKRKVDVNVVPSECPGCTMYMVRSLKKMYTGYEEAGEEKQSKRRSCGRRS
jgi:ribonucleoside-diphosphate reductase alpha chain